jgi:hypothetical protein
MSAELHPNFLMNFIPVANLLPRERRIIRNTASALSGVFQIAPGRELILHLGLGGERSNDEALETWVCQQMLTHRIQPSSESMGWYIKQLERTLNSIQEVAHD